MTPAEIYQAGFGLANVALLTGIFFRLGGLTVAQKDFDRRLGRIENNQKTH